MARRVSVLVVGALTASLVSSVPPAAGQSCPEEPTYNAEVPSPELAIPGFPNRRVTTPEIVDYFEQVGEASERVETGTYGRSYRGTPLVYSLVSKKAGEAPAVARTQMRLRDPRKTGPAAAEAIATGSRAVVWYTANVHGNETSGADAAVTILYELAAREDCAVAEMLDNLVIGIIPTQNPDGRDSFSRTNDYSFDMNRDWFARTQRETDTKISLLESFPPVLFIDAHEMANSSFFFPPNADPIHHEISSEATSWINDIYGPALKKTFEERRGTDPLNWDYFNYNIYDLFYMGYGDSVPSTAFTAAGMTFEKGIADTDRQRWDEQLAAGWTSLEAASKNKTAILRQYYDAHVEALAQGRAGRLEPNEILAPGNEVRRKVPDLRVRHYFIRTKRGGADVAHLTRRLMAMGVEVHRLTAPLRVPDLQRYGRGVRAATLPRGTLWIPLAQPQKHWVQAMLGEDSYVPFPYFYDVTAWSNTLLMALDGSFSGATLRPRAVKLSTPPKGSLRGSRRARFFSWRGDTGKAVATALMLRRTGDFRVSRLMRRTKLGRRALPAGTFVATGPPRAKMKRLAIRFGLSIKAWRGRAPTATAVPDVKVGLFEPAGGGESFGHMRWLFEHAWKLPYTRLTSAQVAAGELSAGEYDVFVVPGVTTEDLDVASAQVRSWIEAGGTFVGSARPGDSGGTPYAIRNGLTTAQAQASNAAIPGTLFRVRLSGRSPLLLGARKEAYWYHLGESLLTPSETGQNLGIFPTKGFWFSGFAEGAGDLRGTAALVEEALGEGRVILFSGEPNYRAYTEGTSFLLANAIAYPGLETSPAVNLASNAARAGVTRARASALTEGGPGRPIQVVVATDETRPALDVVRRFTPNVSARRFGSNVMLVIPNPEGLDPHAHPFARDLLVAFERARVEVLLAIL